ncbi:hypothetical protein D6850_18175 [Roseovarius spongiae]|uniref:Uncharacterized protein n=1 Tax=Roseovarius spongiae TaxID=2320272 RepID=A0A3A8AU71_9RHOB|nr:hypothetical protein [Roseovarius spongiae]RKF12399.1 hypothetical protein D6850_18175 [Roseovarius spongiae]
MTQTTETRGPRISALALFRQIAPTCAQEISHQLQRAGLKNSHDLITALTRGLASFARQQDVCLAADFPKTWPEALQMLRATRSEADWERFLPQTVTASQAGARTLAVGASQMIRVLETLRDAAGMSPRVAVALGAWIVTAVVIAHSGPLDADLSLEELAEHL